MKMVRRRYGNVNASRTENKLRGLRLAQYNLLLEKLRNDAQVVCSFKEEIPFLDYLDLVYTPESKAIWLRMAKELGRDWANGSTGFDQVSHYVRASASKTFKGRGLYINLYNGGTNARLRPQLPQLASGWRHAYFMPVQDMPKLDNPMYNALPGEVMDHYAKYGRHIVRCCREWELFVMAYAKVKVLFDKAVCTREVAHYFPEIIGLIPNFSGELDYLAKTRKNKFSSRFNPKNPDGKYVNRSGGVGGRVEEMTEALGPSWEAYKKHIVSLCSRAVMKRGLPHVSVPSPSYDEENLWYEPVSKGGKDPSEWVVRIGFTPSTDID
jgi:hypothetical protein